MKDRFIRFIFHEIRQPLNSAALGACCGCRQCTVLLLSLLLLLWRSPAIDSVNAVVESADIRSDLQFISSQVHTCLICPLLTPLTACNRGRRSHGHISHRAPTGQSRVAAVPPNHTRGVGDTDQRGELELQLGAADVRDLVRQAALECESLARLTSIKVLCRAAPISLDQLSCCDVAAD